MKIIELTKTYVTVETQVTFANKFSKFLHKLFGNKDSIIIKYNIIELKNGLFVYSNEFNILKMIPHLDSLIFSHPKNPFKSEKIVVPKGWFVADAGQSPLHLLWYLNLVNFNEYANGHKHPRQVFVEEQDSFEEALKEAVKQLKLNV